MKKGTFVLLCIEGAILSFNVAATSALIPSISRDLGIGQVVGGAIVWAYMIPYGIAALFYGPLIRIVEPRKLELFSFSLFSVANLGFALAGTYMEAIGWRFLMGICGASVVPLVLILIGKLAHPRERGKLVGVFFSATFVSSLAGLFLSGILPWRYIYTIPACCGFLLCAIMYRFLPEFKFEKERFSLNYLAPFQDKTILFIFVYIFFVSMFYHGIQQWLGVYLSLKFDFQQFLISMMVTFTSLAGITGEITGGWISDKIGRLKTIEGGLTFMILSAFLLTLKLNKILMAGVFVLWGLGWTINHAGLSSLLTDLPKKYLNEAASLNSGIRFLSGGLGAWLGGLCIKKSPELNFFFFGWALIILAAFARNILHPALSENRR
jgi:predicted MFS family arabinose efflux permease